jgi:hypothetical protein
VEKRARARRRWRWEDEGNNGDGHRVTGKGAAGMEENQPGGTKGMREETVATRLSPGR